MLIWSGESRHPCLVAHLRGKTFHLITAHDVLCGFFVDGFFFYYVEEVSVSNVLIVFIVRRCWILSNAFSSSTDIMFFFFFHSVDITYYADQFTLLKHPCISAINPSWLYYIILVMCCWILFASILFIEDVHKGFPSPFLWFPSLSVAFYDLSIKIILLSEWVGKYSLFFSFRKS